MSIWIIAIIGGLIAVIFVIFLAYYVTRSSNPNGGHHPKPPPGNSVIIGDPLYWKVYFREEFQFYVDVIPACSCSIITTVAGTKSISHRLELGKTTHINWQGDSLRYGPKYPFVFFLWIQDLTTKKLAYFDGCGGGISIQIPKLTSTTKKDAVFYLKPPTGKKNGDYVEIGDKFIITSTDTINTFVSFVYIESVCSPQTSMFFFDTDEGYTGSFEKTV